ncbi:exosortase/archaeosortase family protein [bacterium]|nr:exosortase/archaeosortase family protein [bacterium]
MMTNARRKWAIGILLTAACLFAFWVPLVSMIETWWTIPDYSHGFFVAPLALYLAWTRRQSFPSHGRSAPVAGSILLAMALTASLVGTLAYIRPLAQYAIIPAIAGVVLALRGKRTLWWGLPMIAYLMFAIPLPHSIASHLALPLQHWGASGAVYLLETAGIPALADGTLIELENDQLNVAFACSGLQMVISFGAVCTAIAMLSNYSTVGKILISVSAVPIAVACNILRIALISWAHRYELVPPKQMHDAGGILIVPVTVAIVFLGIFLFEKCFPATTREAR